MIKKTLLRISTRTMDDALDEVGTAQYQSSPLRAPVPLSSSR